MMITDEGILTRILWYERFIEWDRITKVRISPRKIFISDGYLIPIFALAWRRNFTEVKDFLRDKIPDKVSESLFYELW